MPASNYPFIDVVILDGVRERFAAADAVAVLSVDLDHILWANGAGAGLFGQPDVETAAGADSGLGAAAKRQIMATRGFPAIGRDRQVMVRLAHGVAGFLASAITMPDGEAAILLALPAAMPGQRDAEIAARAIGGFTQPGHLVALLDGAGSVLSASPDFSALGLSQQTLGEFAAEAGAASDRLVKRLVAGYPAGIARLADDPVRHFLVVVDEAVQKVASEAEDPAEATMLSPVALADGAMVAVATDGTLPDIALSPEAEAVAEDEAVADAPVASTFGAAPLPTGGETEPTDSLASQDPSVEPTGTTSLPPFAAITEPAGNVMDQPASEVFEPEPPTGRVAPEDEAFQNETPETDAVSMDPAGDPRDEDDAGQGDFFLTEADAVPEQAGPQEPAQPDAEAEEPAAAVAPATPIAAATRPVPDRTAPPLRFVWKTDSTGRFSAISPEFAKTVGLTEAEVLGRPFSQVAARLGLDASGEIAALLERRDTWSGRSVLWPIAGAGLKVPVDLAALPVYARDRSFEGFRGFGVARIADAVEDPHAIGLTLAAAPAESVGVPEVSAAANDSTADAAPNTTAEPSPEPEAQDPFKGEVPALKIVPKQERRLSDKVIRLAEHRASESGLSPVERNAFREIGEKLRKVEAAETIKVTGVAEPQAAEPVVDIVESASPSATETTISRSADVSVDPVAEDTQAAGHEMVTTESERERDEDTTTALRGAGHVITADSPGDGSQTGTDSVSVEADPVPATLMPSPEDATRTGESSGETLSPAVLHDIADAASDLRPIDTVSAPTPIAEAFLDTERDGTHVAATADAEAADEFELSDAGTDDIETSVSKAEAGFGAVEAVSPEIADEVPEDAPDGIDTAPVREMAGPPSTDPVEDTDAGTDTFEASGGEAGTPAVTPDLQEDQTGDGLDASSSLEPRADAEPAAAIDADETVAAAEHAAPTGADEAGDRDATIEAAAPEGSPEPSDDVHGDSEDEAATQPADGFASREASILSRLPVPILIHAGDALHYANDEFLTLTGHASLQSLEQAGGLGSLFADRYADDAGDGGDRALRLRAADGHEFPIDALLRSVPWNGGHALMLVVRRAGDAPEPAAPPARDDRAEMKAHIAELRTIIDTATDGVIVIATNGLIRSISRPAEALFGYDSDDIAGKAFASLFAMESQRAARDYLAGLSDNGVASVLNDGREVIGREAQGRFIPLFLSIGRLPGDSGFCAVVRDITPWKRAEEELTKSRALAERASSQKSDFLARISHEIRTPLNAIIGFSELMVDERFGPVGNDRYRDYLRDINRSGNHVLDLVNDLLDISKIEAGEQDMTYEAVSLNDTLAQTVAMMQPQANRERVIIRSSFASRLPDVVADLRSVRQIALNLLSNAVRYTQAGGQVIVSTAYEPSGDVVMRVRDTGIGMSPAEIEQAMKPFKQINALKGVRNEGTGLGLPLTKAMVEANRARFSINSTPGEGTLVEVTFPSTRVLAE